MSPKIYYRFSAQPWQYTTSGSWCFVSLPATMSSEIRSSLQWQEEGWGRLKVVAEIGGSKWETAIWYDTKHKTYLLPLKAEIRKKEQIETGRSVDVVIRI